MSIKLTNTQLATLSAAAQREDRCLTPPTPMRGAQTAKTAEKLIAAGLVREVKAKPPAPAWRRDGETESVYALKLTAAGMKAAAVLDHQTTKEQPASEGDPAVAQTRPAAPPAIADKKPPAPLPTPTPAAPTSCAPAPRAQGESRPNSKIAGVIMLLTQSGGVTLEEMIAATGWLPHTTRAALTGLRKRGYAIALDRSDRERGSIYRAELKVEVGAGDPPATAAKAA